FGPVAPTLRPVRALLARISLGPSPWLHRLRNGWLSSAVRHRRVRYLVRQLHSYYGGVRLLVPVHHRLRLLAFPMRTVPLTQHLTARHETRDLPASDAIPLHVMWPSTPAGRQHLA